MPIIEPAPCYRRFVSFDTSIRGTCELVAAMARINVIDCEANPRLFADLNRRCRAVLQGMKDGGPGIPPGWKVAALEYEDEPVDKWASFSVMAERNPKQTIRADCDCLSPLWAAFFKLHGIPSGIGISQPRQRKCCKGPQCRDGRLCGHGMAHAYTLIERDGVEVFDGSVLGGMGEPKAGFYGSGEHAEVWL